MYRFLTFFAFLFLAAPLANAAENVGDPCSTIGRSKMAQSKDDLIVCLQNSPTDSSLIWKSMTTSGGGSSGGFTPVGAAGTASADGLLFVISKFNKAVRIFVNGSVRWITQSRDSYGSGRVSGVTFLKKGDAWIVDSVNSYTDSVGAANVETVYFRPL